MRETTQLKDLDLNWLEPCPVLKGYKSRTQKFDGFRSSKQSNLPPQIEAGPGGAGKVQADQLVLSEQVRASNRPTCVVNNQFYPFAILHD